MNRFVEIIAAAAIGVGALVFASEAFTQKNYSDITTIRDATVQISILDKNGKDVGSCSGSVIDDPDLSNGEQVTVLTAGHCALEGGYAAITEKILIGNRLLDGKTYYFTIGDKSKKADVSIYQGYGVPLEAFPTKAKLYGGTVSFGDKIYVSGFPLGLTQDLRDGYVGYVEPNVELNKQMDLTDVEVLRVSLSTSPGHSGSGVYKLTDDGYELIGVMSGAYLGMMAMESTIAYSVTTENVKEFLRNFGKGVNGESS